MKTAITIIAICEVIRTIQISINLVMGAVAKKKAIENIVSVRNSVADLTPDKVARAIINEVAESKG